MAEKEIKGIQVGKKEIKLFPLENVIVLYLGNPKDYSKLFSPRNTSSQVSRYKTNLQKSVTSLYMRSNLQKKKEIKGNMLCIIRSKIIR